MHVKLTISIIVNDHGDGYCSGCECEVTERIKKKIVKMPEHLLCNNYNHGDSIDPKIYDWKKEINSLDRKVEREVANRMGSGYCTPGGSGMGAHSHELEIISVKVL